MDNTSIRMDSTCVRVPEERQAKEIQKKAAEYVRLSRQADEIKREIDDLKGWFEARGIKDLDATKIKMVDYWCQSGKIEVGRSEKVTPIALTVLKSLFGDIYPEFVKPKETLEMTSACKQLLAPIYLGNYVNTPMEEIIASATKDEKAQAALLKKLRGNFKKDKAAFQSIAGLNDYDSSYYAYMTTESAAYFRFKQILQAADWKGTEQQAIDIIKAAVIVEEGVNVTVDDNGDPIEDDITAYVTSKMAETGITGIDLPDFETIKQVDDFFKVAQKLMN